MANAPTPRGGPGGPGGRGARGGFQKPKHLRKTMIRMFSYLTRRPVLLAIALFCVIAAALSSVAGTYFMRPIINSITEAAKNGQTDLPGLLTSILQLLAVYAIAAVWPLRPSVPMPSPPSWPSWPSGGAISCGKSCLTACRSCPSATLTGILTGS